jgi:hypothetical protein
MNIEIDDLPWVSMGGCYLYEETPYLVVGLDYIRTRLRALIKEGTAGICSREYSLFYSARPDKSTPSS